MKNNKKSDNKILRFLGFDADFKAALPSMVNYNWAVFLGNGSFYIIGLFLIPHKPVLWHCVQNCVMP